MEITTEQIRTAERGECVDLRFDDTDFVLIRKDVYETARQLAYDDSDLTEGEMDALAQQMFEDVDTAGPIP